MTSQYPVGQSAQYVRPARVVPDYLIPERDGISAWWSNLTREGEWLFPRIYRAFAFMANVEIDLTSARLGAGVSEIDIRCIFANIEIQVPPDVRVLCDGKGLVGNFEVVRVGDTTSPADAPTLRIIGTAYFGSVTVKIVGSGVLTWTEKLKAGWKSLGG